MVLAYASDLATGHSRDFALRSCVLAMRIADLAELPEQDRRNAYHQAMLRYVGCNADTHLALGRIRRRNRAAQGPRRARHGQSRGTRTGSSFKPSSGSTSISSPAGQQQAIEAGLAQAAGVSRPVLTAHCEVAQRIGERLGLSEEIRRNLGQIYERWDGKGLPRGLSGDEVLPAVRLITLAQDCIALSDAVGVDGNGRYHRQTRRRALRGRARAAGLDQRGGADGRHRRHGGPRDDTGARTRSAGDAG